MARINVVLRKEDLEPSFLHDKVAVVIDVLFATSSIVTALNQGATDVYPVLNQQMALETVRGFAQDSFVLSGEQHLRSIAGFSAYTPLALSRQSLRGRSLVYATTNGTVALRQANSAAQVYAAALLNAPAVVNQLQQHKEQTLVLICSGSAGRVNLEDLYLAGYLIEQLSTQHSGRWQLTDTCQIALAVYRQYESPEHCLRESQLGRALSLTDMNEEINYSARLGCIDLVPKLNGASLQVA
ncbi:2-phosphosulfolactate phosphatase [Pseudomonas sp. GD03860]|uniref:2-phosphosulfolactate phosphatase n=1 Tax=Pseudomonas TaxID=286 RepID=UPI002363B8D9|nr:MULTISPECIES: 2-phosphosulfolactate phosphatase [Pseudomonas]MDD2058423.1 2-phosphosulfolactate phosphatase [Pseudomonas putida]MDH0640235.1 2-phosphosulfolactate phosphatase [Pseudomonas sp. GD03860]